METQKTKLGFEEGMMLQSQRDGLRSQLQAMSRTGQFSKTWDEKNQLLQRLDRLFSLHCKNCDLKLSKFGRLN
jgi:SMC interacting uncharacterized protein involved in chromosome segregation